MLRTLFVSLVLSGLSAYSDTDTDAVPRPFDIEAILESKDYDPADFQFEIYVPYEKKGLVYIPYLVLYQNEVIGRFRIDTFSEDGSLRGYGTIVALPGLPVPFWSLGLGTFVYLTAMKFLFDRGGESIHMSTSVNGGAVYLWQRFEDQGYLADFLVHDIFEVLDSELLDHPGFQRTWRYFRTRTRVFDENLAGRLARKAPGLCQVKLRSLAKESQPR